MCIGAQANDDHICTRKHVKVQIECMQTLLAPVVRLQTPTCIYHGLTGFGNLESYMYQHRANHNGRRPGSHAVANYENFLLAGRGSLPRMALW